MKYLVSILYVDITLSLLDEILKSKQSQIPEQEESYPTHPHRSVKTSCIHKIQLIT